MCLTIIYFQTFSMWIACQKLFWNASFCLLQLAINSWMWNQFFFSSSWRRFARLTVGERSEGNFQTPVTPIEYVFHAGDFPLNIVCLSSSVLFFNWKTLHSSDFDEAYPKSPVTSAVKTKTSENTSTKLLQAFEVHLSISVNLPQTNFVKPWRYIPWLATRSSSRLSHV